MSFMGPEETRLSITAIGKGFRDRSWPGPFVKKLLKRFLDGVEIVSSSRSTIEIAPYGQRSAQMPQPIQLSVIYTSPLGRRAIPARLHTIHTGSWHLRPALAKPIS